MLSHFRNVWLFVTLWTIASQALLSMGFSKQEYWSGLPCPPTGDSPDPGIEHLPLMSLALAGRFCTTEPLGKPRFLVYLSLFFFFNVQIFSLSPISCKVKVTQSCPTLCDPMDFTVHGILQARILEWVAFPSSRGSSQPRDRTQVSCTVGEFFYQLSHKGSPYPVKALFLLFMRFLREECNLKKGC